MEASSRDNTVPAFSIVKRGYPPAEVDAQFLTLARDLTAAEQELHAVRSEADGSARQLAATHIELQRLREQLETAEEELKRQTGQPITMSALSGRMQRLVEIAEEESAEMRTAADQYRTDVRVAADVQARRTREDADAYAAKVREAAEADAQQLRKDLEAELVHARREIAEERSEVEQARSTVYEQAKRLLTDAQAEAEKTISAAREQAEELSARAAEDRTKLEKDYAEAVDSRRRQAYRAIAEAEEASRAESQHRTEQANAHAQSVVQSATAHADELLRRTAAESHRRVAEADEAVNQLQALRRRLHSQVSDLSALMSDLTDQASTVRKALDPLPGEDARPALTAFPASIEPGLSADGSWQPPTPSLGSAWERVTAQLDHAVSQERNHSDDVNEATTDASDEVLTESARDDEDTAVDEETIEVVASDNADHS